MGENHGICECSFWDQLFQLIISSILIYSISMQPTRETQLSQNAPSTHLQQPLDKQKLFFNMIHKVGSFGAYQKIVLLLLCLATCLNGQIIFAAPYLFYQDAYYCPSTLPAGTSCSTYVCGLPLPQRTQFIPAKTMETLANKFGDFRCSSESGTVSLSILITYLGVVGGNALMAVFGDYFGRKTFTVVGLSVAMSGLLVTILGNHIYVSSVGTMISIIGFQWIFCISMTIISQIVDQAHREYCLIALQIFFNLGHLVDTGLYFWLRHWQQVFIYFFIIPLLLILIVFIFFTVDTPIALVTNLPPQEALSKLLWIAKVNRVESPDLKIQEIEQAKTVQQTRQKQQQTASKFTVLDLFRYPSLRWLTIFLMIVQVSISFIFFSPNLMLNDFQLNIFINGLVLGVSYVISEVFCYLVVKNCKRKILAVGSMAVILACSIVLVFVYKPKDEREVASVTGNIGILAILFIITFCVSAEYTYFYVYLTELYPTQVRVIGLSLVTFSGAITLAVSQYIIDSCLSSGFNVMIVFSLFALVSLVASFFLPETLENPAGQLILELSQQMKGTWNRGKDMSAQQLQRRQRQEYGVEVVIQLRRS